MPKAEEKFLELQKFHIKICRNRVGYIYIKTITSKRKVLSIVYKRQLYFGMWRISKEFRVL